jgi:hypothetical protein
MTLSLAALALVAGCSSSEPGSSPGTATARTVSVSVSPPASRAASTVETLPCDEYISTSRPTADLTVVDDVVALPASPRARALHVSASGYHDPQVRLFAKSGLEVRNGAAFTISVPPRLATVAAIGWSNSATPPTHRLVVPGCRVPEATWLAYPGGYWAAYPMCLPLRITVDGRVMVVQIGVGTACPGQDPPGRLPSP